MDSPQAQAAAGALSGVKVVDLSRVFAGPLCTQLLGDHGADVIKVEPPQGDETRDWGVAGTDDVSSYYWGLNRNKRCISLDLRLQPAREVLLHLLATADVLVENFKAGTLEAWGLGTPDDLQARFPRLVHLTISGYGSAGPLAGQPGYDAVAQAVTGLMSVNGPAGGPALKLPLPLVDHSAGVHACAAIAMALLERTRSSRGQHIGIALYDVGLSMTHPLSTAWQFDGRTPQPVGNAYGALAPYGTYRAADGDVFIGAGNQGAFRRLCAALGCAAVADDPRFATNRLRVQHRDELDALLAPAVAPRAAGELAAALMHAGVAAGPVQDMRQAFEHPQTAAARMWPPCGPRRVIASPIKLQRTPARLRRPPGAFGADGEEVLREAGCDTGRREELAAQGAWVRRRLA